VSRVLANEPGISESVRRAYLRWLPSTAIRRRQHPKPFLGGLALIASDGVTGGLSVFYEAIVDGLRTGALEAGMPFEVRLVREDRATPDGFVRLYATASAEGLFLVGIDPNPALRQWIEAERIPVVLVNGTDPQLRLDGVSPANFFGAFQAAADCSPPGPSRILHFSGSHRHTIRERVRGLRGGNRRRPRCREPDRSDELQRQRQPRGA
jgi:DNA-binding LacI/PurR family transcriptional regulator